MRLAIFAAMAALLVAALCVPGAFGDLGVELAVAYAVVRAAHIALFVLASHDEPGLRRSVIGLGASTAIACGIFLVGAFIEGDARTAVWVGALSLDMAGSFVYPVEGWRLAPGHFAERHGLILIIALGESIVAIGVGAEAGVDGGVIAAAVLGVAFAAGLWWAYFDVAALFVANRLTTAELGRSAERVGPRRVLVDPFPDGRRRRPRSAGPEDHARACRGPARRWQQLPRCAEAPRCSFSGTSRSNGAPRGTVSVPRLVDRSRAARHHPARNRDAGNRRRRDRRDGVLAALAAFETTRFGEERDEIRGRRHEGRRVGRAPLRAVRDAFAANFAERGEVGAAVCVYVDGRPVVDLWGGVADRDTGRGGSRTRSCPSSRRPRASPRRASTWPSNAGCSTPTRRSPSYWPEFAANGKAAITVRQVHESPGRAAARGGRRHAGGGAGVGPDGRAARRPGADLWRPAPQHGYHMRTYGWLAGELIRRTTGRTVGRYLARRDRGSARHRLLDRAARGARAPRRPAGTRRRSTWARRWPGSANRCCWRACSPTRAGTSTTTRCGTPAPLHACELPSSNGIGERARLGPAVRRRRRRRRRRAATAATRDRRGGHRRAGPRPGRGDHGRDRVRARLHARPQLRCRQPARAASVTPAPAARCHSPIPIDGVGFGYVMNDLRFDPNGDPRSESLVAALYDALG